MGFASNPEWTIPTLLLHLALNVSSFEFVIPKRRIRDGGRIWPEYRLHAIIFLSRSVLAVVLRWYLEHHSNGIENNKEMFYACNLAIVLWTMASADLASYVSGEYHSSSIRDADLPVAVKYMFSLAQFGATAWTLCSRCSAAVWYFAFVAQLNPFGMTLVRKNFISHKTNMTLYALELFGGYFPFYLYPCFKYEFPGMGPAPIGLIMGIAVWWRMGPWPKLCRPLQNKYLIWTTMYFLYTRVILPLTEQDPYLPNGDITATVFNVQLAQNVFLRAFVAYIIYEQFKGQPVADLIDRLMKLRTNDFTRKALLDSFSCSRLRTYRASVAKRSKQSRTRR